MTETEVVSWYQTILDASAMTIVTKQYAVMSLTKLSTRFSQVTGDIQHIIDGFGTHLDSDLQQRGVEFGQLFRSQAGMRGQLLEPMPVLEKEKSLGQGSQQAPAVRENGGGVSVPVPEAGPSSGLMDLLGLDDGAGLLAQPAPLTQSTSALDDILGLGDTGPGLASLPTPASLPGGMSSLLDIAAPSMSGAAPVQAPAHTNGGLDGLLNGLDTMGYTSPGPSTVPPLTAYEKHGLRVVFTFPSASATPTNILLLANNLTSGPITDFHFQVRILIIIINRSFHELYQAAVPKSMSLHIENPSSPSIAPGGQVTQQLQVTNPSLAPLKMKLKISFVSGGAPVSDVGEVANFPQVLFSPGS